MLYWEDMVLINDTYIKIIESQDIINSILRNKKRIIGKKDFGLLIGSVEKKDGIFVVNIEIILPIGKLKGINNRLGDMEWLEIKAKVADKYLGKEIVGWYGVRSGWDAMMLEEDQSIHRNFFNKDWQVMYLLDDKNSRASFYIWRNSSLKAYSDHYTYNQFGEKREKVQKKWLVPFLIVVPLIFFIYSQYMKFNIYDGHSNPDNELGEENRESQGINSQDPEAQYKEIDKGYRQEVESDDVYDKSKEELSKLKETIHRLEGELDYKEQEIKDMDNRQDESILAKGIVYKVEVGDTLSSISEKFYGDSKYSNSLGKVNRISDHRTLQVGSYLVIPSKEEIEKLK